jgi:hypothetical protein
MLAERQIRVISQAMSVVRVMTGTIGVTLLAADSDLNPRRL